MAGLGPWILPALWRFYRCSPENCPGTAQSAPRRHAKSGLVLSAVARSSSGIEPGQSGGHPIPTPLRFRVGPPIDRRMLRKLGKQSAPAYRALLYLACEWDRYGGHNGRLVRPTRPEVLRDPTGHVLEATGTVALEQDRRPATSPHHPLAVHTGGRELNPARSRYPGYEGDALIGLCYQIDGIPNDQRRKYLTRAVKTLEYMQSIGAVSIERMNPGWKHGLPWRIMPPDIIQTFPYVIRCPV